MIEKLIDAVLTYKCNTAGYKPFNLLRRRIFYRGEKSDLLCVPARRLSRKVYLTPHPLDVSVYIRKITQFISFPS